jgi:mxaJ protein
VLARELDEDVRYFWWPQRRGFIRHTLDESRCDVVMGVPAGFERVLTTAPYYRSTYVFVSRRGATRVRSFDDPALGRLRIGVQFTGDGGNPPPAQALAHRGLAGNIVSFSVYGDYRQHDPPARLIEAVARRRIDLAVAWGPLAGYFATRVGAPLDVVPVPVNEGGPGAPMSFAIAVGVRRTDTARRERLQRALERRAGEIHQILLRYGVPLVDSAVGASR